MSQFAVLCPGQGLQSPEMFGFADADPAGSAVLATFEHTLGMDLRGTAASGADLFDNRFAQPAIVAVACATWAVLQSRLAASALSPALFAGYSVGEVSAWACAGAWSAAQAAQIVQARAQRMDAASPEGFGMLAVLGLPRQALAALAAAQADVHVAIVNDHDHVVVAGPHAALDALAVACRGRGATTRRLDVKLPSHTPLLAAAAQAFGGDLRTMPTGPVAAPVLRGIDGRQLLRGQDCAAALSCAVAAPIDWAACMRELAEAGITVALELGPGRSLSKLVTDAHPGIAARSVADFRSAGGVVAWLDKQLQR